MISPANKIFLLCLSLWVIATNSAEEEPNPVDPETQKIEALLDAIAKSKYVFIRNKKEHTGEEAAAFLRAKWEGAKEQIKTADDFIRICATKSETAGGAYQVVINGRFVDLAGWLQVELALIDAPAAPDAGQVANYLKNLGSDSYEERERATEALVRLGEAVRPAIEECKKTTRDAEVQVRCDKILKAIGDPNKTGVQVLELLEASAVRVKRPGAKWRKEVSGKSFAAHLRGKAFLEQIEVTVPAREFIEKLSTTSSLHNSTYRVVVEDGTERDLAPWLREKLKLKE